MSKDKQTCSEPMYLNITERELHALNTRTLDGVDLSWEQRMNIVARVCSRARVVAQQAPAATLPCDQFPDKHLLSCSPGLIQNIKDHHAAIRAQAREDVLDKLSSKIIKETGIGQKTHFDPNDNRIPSLDVSELSDIVQSLRPEVRK